MPDTRAAHQLVADRYELLETVGRGGFGVVWRACDTLLERHVAVKEVHIPGFLDEQDRVELREKVLKEARAAARLDHPGAVTVYDVIDDDGRPVIVMELVAAPTLAQLVAERGPLPPAEVARIGLEVLAVLEAAHEHGIVHRDVKPANVMVADSGRVRLGDFGVAAILDDPTVSTSGAVTGSPAYMAPEQATNKGAIAESDLWSLGATMYFAVEGQPPFDKGAALPTLASIVQDPPRTPERAGALQPVLAGLLVKSPAERLRPPELRERLAAVVSAPPVPPVATVEDTAVFRLEETAPGPAAVAPPPPARPAAPTLPAPPAAAEPSPAAPIAAEPPAPPAAADGLVDPRPYTTPDRPHAAPAGPRRAPAALLGVVALVVVGLIAVLLATRHSSSPSSTATSPSTTSSGAAASTSKTTKAGSTSSSGATSSYTDPQTGFTISYPKGWSVSTNGTLTDFRDPDTGAYLRVDHIQPPGPSPEGAWFELEKSFSAQNPNYQRIRIEPTTYSGYRAGIWEYTYSGGGADLHAVDLGFITPRYGFALNFQTRAADWDRLQPVFQAFKDSFKAPS